MDNRCNKCGHISEAHPDGGACYNIGCSCTRLETDKNIELENLIVRYNELLEKSDRQREQIAILEQSRADIRLENKRLLGCMDSYNQELVESMTENEQLEVRIEELEAMTQWQPIETAPKDKTILRLYDPIYNIQSDGYFFADLNIWVGNAIEIHPTHWLRKPPPPKEGEK